MRSAAALLTILLLGLLAAPASAHRNYPPLEGPDGQNPRCNLFVVGFIHNPPNNAADDICARVYMPRSGYQNWRRADPSFANDNSGDDIGDGWFKGKMDNSISFFSLSNYSNLDICVTFYFGANFTGMATPVLVRTNTHRHWTPAWWENDQYSSLSMRIFKRTGECGAGYLGPGA